VNLNCITNRAAQGPEYKLSYDARTIKEHTHSSYYVIPATPAPNRATTLLQLADKDTASQIFQF
jgi:hypothetical protein